MAWLHAFHSKTIRIKDLNKKERITFVYTHARMHAWERKRHHRETDNPPFSNFLFNWSFNFTFSTIILRFQPLYFGSKNSIIFTSMTHNACKATDCKTLIFGKDKAPVSFHLRHTMTERTNLPTPSQILGEKHWKKIKFHYIFCRPFKYWPQFQWHTDYVVEKGQMSISPLPELMSKKVLHIQNQNSTVHTIWLCT